MSWFGYLTADEPAAGDAPTARYDVVLAGKGRTLRAVEADAPPGLSGQEVRCVLDRYEPADVTASMWSGLIYPLKPSHEETVSGIFSDSGRPDHEVKDDDGNVVGHLLRTLVFVGDGIAIRVIEVDGDLRTVSRHMSRQAPVRAFEREVEEHLAVPRDMVTPEGAMKFFAEAGMQAVSVKSQSPTA